MKLSRRAGIMLGIMVVIILVAAIIGVYVEQVTADVPELIGKNYAKAKTMVEKAELTHKHKVVYSDKKKGTVIFQEPKANERVVKGSKVKITVSKGLPKVSGVVGLSKEEAETKISEDREAGFSANIIEQYNNDIPASITISQNPEANAFASVGSIVDLVISKGLPQIPDVSGLSREEAETKISEDKEAGFNVNIIEQYNNDIPANTVISQSLEPGAFVVIGSKIDLIISKGKPTVPDVVGKNKDEAKSLIEADKEAGFIFSSSREYNGSVPAGNVISQDPQGGTQVTIGSTVKVVISRGAKPEPKPESSSSAEHWRTCSCGKSCACPKDKKCSGKY